MKRLYPWLIGAGLLGPGCSPESNVQPGAPVLTLMTIVESGGITDISGGEPACPATAQDGAVCDPMTDGLCQTTESWCRCLSKNPMDPTSEADWSCRFEPTSTVVATFDRLLDTGPLDYDQTMAAGRTDVATITSLPGTAPDALVDYASNGSETALIFKLFSNTIHGPRLLISGSPTLPAGSTVTVALDRAKVRAKDHTSLFVGSGVIQDGTLTFATASFTASIDVPVAPPPDAGASAAGADADTDGGAAEDAPDAGTDAPAGETGSADGGAETAPAPLPAPVMAGMQTVTITFDNLTVQADTINQIAVTVNGAAFTDVAIAATDTMTAGAPARVYAVTPSTPGGSWPSGAVITVTVAATAADTQGVALGAPASATFVTEP